MIRLTVPQCQQVARLLDSGRCGMDATQDVCAWFRLLVREARRAGLTHVEVYRGGRWFAQIEAACRACDME